MLFEEKTQNNIMIDLVASVSSDMSTEEGTLINHSFRGAAAEFEQAYMGLGMVDQNGYAVTADREHLILRAMERGLEPIKASNAIWKAEFNINVPINTRFSSKELTYVCTEQLADRTYKVMCEQLGTIGNTKRGNLDVIAYLEGYETGKLIELITPARDEEETDAFRARYLDDVAAPRAFGGNRAQYKQFMKEIPGVGACKIYRATKEERRIKIYFLNSLYQVPSETLVKEVQEIMDPLEKQGDGEGKAALFHVVDIYPCEKETMQIEADFTLETGYEWEAILEKVQEKIDKYFSELSRGWEDAEHITVRILQVNMAVAEVEGVLDIQNTTINGKEENSVLDPNAIPVRGEIICRQES